MKFSDFVQWLEKNIANEKTNRSVAPDRADKLPRSKEKNYA